MNISDSLSRIVEINRRQSFVLSAIIVLVASLSIVSTYRYNSPTWDEPTHIAAALELLQTGSYTMQTENPPLSRLPTAIGPYIDGARISLQPTRFMFTPGNEILYSDDGLLEGRFNSARLGVLPFFIISAGIIWFWLAEISALSALFGVLLFATLPMVLAHSGLATTDIPFVAAFLAAAYALRLWIESSNLKRSVLLGVAVGAAITTKFTTIPFLIAMAVALFGTWVFFERPDLRSELTNKIPKLAVSVFVCCLVIWTVYAFDLGKISEFPASSGLFGQVYGEGVTGFRGALGNFLLDRTIPAPGFFHGLLMVAAHNDAGHQAFSLGQFSQSGFWFYYPLTMAVKTPVPFLLFLIAGLGSLVLQKSTRWWQWGVIISVLLIFVSLLTSNVNIGGRHAMVIYPLIIIAIAPQVVKWFPREKPSHNKLILAPVLVCAFLLWAIGTTIATYPGYLSYVNWFAGDDQGYVVSDSDLDWGQSVYALRDYLEEVDEPVSLFYNGSAQLCQLGLTGVKAYSPDQKPEGIVVISERIFRIMVARVESGEAQFSIGPVRSDICDPTSFGRVVVNADQLQWLLTEKPITIVDKTLRVYRM